MGDFMDDVIEFREPDFENFRREMDEIVENAITKKEAYVSIDCVVSDVR